MAKLDQYMQGRTEGMEFALRLVKDKGIEGLEKEIRFRNRSGISLNVTSQELNAASDKIKDMTLDTVTALGIAALHDCFGFGKKRCERWKDTFKEGAKLLQEDMATWQDYINSIEEEIGISLKIRWNE